MPVTVGTTNAATAANANPVRFSAVMDVSSPLCVHDLSAMDTQECGGRWESVTTHKLAIPDGCFIGICMHRTTVTCGEEKPTPTGTSCDHCRTHRGPGGGRRPASGPWPLGREQPRPPSHTSRNSSR
ncbi:hypothetical protein GCM10010335_06150 [Streptomyces galbus]|nr:hypothetical protein GCM10010335_06150 [Streptomyces galbus]